jgi:hypothetical protein
MRSGCVFISHATIDDAFVSALRRALESLHIPVWVDSRNLRVGDTLAPEIAEAIAQARQVLVVLSPQTINSPWVRREIRQALEVAQSRQTEGYRVIPLLLPGVEPSALDLWFEAEPVAVPVRLTTAGLSKALPRLLAALGERALDDLQPVQDVAAPPVEDLVLELRDPHIQTLEGKHRVAAMATLVYAPADPAVRGVESRRFAFTAPLGPIEADDLRWYLESYYLWPTGVFKARAERIEAQLPQWGQDLYHAVIATQPEQCGEQLFTGAVVDRLNSLLWFLTPPTRTITTAMIWRWYDMQWKDPMAMRWMSTSAPSGMESSYDPYHYFDLRRRSTPPCRGSEARYRTCRADTATCERASSTNL